MEENNNQFNNPNQNANEQNTQQYYQAPPQGYYPNGNVPPQEEKANVGLAIISYFIPLVGLILYLTQKDSKPKTAKACGKCALASVIINLVIVIASYAVMGAAMFSALGY